MKNLHWLLQVLFLACVASCQASEPILIGVCVPLTGHRAVEGRRMWEGIKLAHYMRPEVLGRDVELRLADTSSGKAEAVTALFRLVEKDRVIAAIDATRSGCEGFGRGASSMPPIPVVGPCADTTLFGRGASSLVEAAAMNPCEASIAATFALERLGARKAAVIQDVADERGLCLADRFKREFVALGGETPVQIRMKTGDRDFSAAVFKLRSAGADVVYAPIGYTELAMLARDARCMGLKTVLLAGDSARVPEAIELGGKAVENVMFITPFHEQMALTDTGKDLRDLCSRRIGRRPDSAHVLAADAYFMIVRAIQAAGVADPGRIRDCLDRTVFYPEMDGALPKENGPRAVVPVFVSVVRDGRFALMGEEGLQPLRNRALTLGNGD